MSHLASIADKLAKPTKTKTKAMRQKNPPIKVVYISNPMKVKTSASRFRALVQQLTGRDSEFPTDPTVYEDDGTDHDSADKINVLVGGDNSNDNVNRLRGSGKSRSSPAPEGSSSATTTATTSSCEVEGEELLGGACYGDEFLMMDDGQNQMVENLPVLGSEAFLWTTWMC